MKWNNRKCMPVFFFIPILHEFKKDFFKKFTLIQAAGGLIRNEKDEILLIFRRGKWDLPKGKLDTGETLEECAVREVEEETGLKKIKLISPLIITYHTYHEGARFVLKESHWYSMTVRGKQTLIPQTEEDIHEIKWVAISRPGSIHEKFLSFRCRCIKDCWTV